MLVEKQIEKILLDLLREVILQGEEPDKSVNEKIYEIQILFQNNAIKTEEVQNMSSGILHN
ncbi:hypothetical protein [Leptospira bandrabouensis]|uniref:hypothetical protein n=1 Tax=Leptospira bandrabouensis TaxID=2484903 RepID=UPI00109112CE|nr:hypothetical protein [Leptospira bandrabouensis]TGN08603.1 hypothetical protein EHR07_03545 [Leptospira bandrabouensis]